MTARRPPHELAIKRPVLAAVLAAVLAFAAATIGASVALANPIVEKVVAVERGGYTMAGVVTRLESARAVRRGIALFPGYPGIMRIRDEAGTPRFELRANFVVRSRALFADDETIVVSIDAPSDQWGGFPQSFRETPRYGADVGALLEAIGAKHGIDDWTFIGSSEGSVSAYHAARMNPRLVSRLVLAATAVAHSRNGPGLSGVRWSEAGGPPTLFVHHVDDPCGATPYDEAAAAAKAHGSMLVTVRGGGPFSGRPCQPFTQHGFAGMEPLVVEAIRTWTRTGRAPEEVR